jgi:hypothetical protein
VTRFVSQFAMTDEQLVDRCREMEREYGGRYVCVRDGGIPYFIDMDRLFINGRRANEEELAARFGPMVRA